MIFVYIDGYNLYHAIQKFPNQNLKWVSLPNLLERVYGKNKNYKIKFFTSRPEHIKYEGDSKLIRHDSYVEVQKELGVEIINGNFARRKVKCKRCDNHGLICPNCNDKRLHSHEEKQTDVNLAVNILSDAFLCNPTEIIICSSDTDFIPVINCLKTHNLVQTIRLLVPPNIEKVPQDLRNALSNFYNISSLQERNNNALKITIMKELHLLGAKLDDTFNINGKMFINPYI